MSTITDFDGDLACGDLADIEGSYATDFGLVVIDPEKHQMCACLMDQVFDLIEYPNGWFGLSTATGLSPSLPKGQGILTLEARAEGGRDAVRFSTRASAESLRLEGLPEASLRAALAGTPDAVEITELVLDAAGGRLEGRGEIRPPGKGASSFRLAWKDFDLARLRGFVPKLPALAAVVEGEVVANWDDWRPESVRAEGRGIIRAPTSPAGKAGAPAVAPTVPPATNAAFRSAYGRLPWPTSGRVVRGYGIGKDPLTGESTRNTGVDIEAAYGTPFRAVYAGTVHQAGFIRGFGHFLSDTLPEADDRSWAISQVIEVEAPEAVEMLQKAMAGLLGEAPRRARRAAGAQGE